MEFPRINKSKCSVSSRLFSTPSRRTDGGGAGKRPSFLFIIMSNRLEKNAPTLLVTLGRVLFLSKVLIDSNSTPYS
jgi:hypothetical protein